MLNTKLFVLLQSFSAKERRRFAEFLASPVFNKREDLILLYDAICHLWSNTPQVIASLNKEQLHQKAFPKEAFEERQFNHRSSQLSLLAEQFLGWLTYQQDGTLTEYHQLKACVDRSLHKNVKYLSQKMEKKLDALPYRNADFYFQQYLYYLTQDQYFTSQKIRKFDKNLLEANTFFDRYFLSRKLALVCAALERKSVFAYQESISLESELLKIIKTNQFNDQPAIAIYGNILLMLKEEKEVSHYQHFRLHFKEFHSFFTPGEIQLFYQFAINYCSRKIRFGDKAYAEEMLQWYQESLAGGYLLENDQISPWAYKNIVKLGLGLRRFAWVETFIREFTPKLPEDKKEDAFHFNLADLYYHRKAYNDALQQLNVLEFSDVHYKLDARIILLKIYYETREFDALHSLISSFRIFLLRHKEITKAVKTPYLNFLSILNRMLTQGETKAEAIAKKIQQTNVLSSRSWLLQQIQQL